MSTFNRSRTESLSTFAGNIEVRRIADTGSDLLDVIVLAVGRPGAETPIGRNFYVQARFAPGDPFDDLFVLETSAMLSDSAERWWAGRESTGRIGRICSVRRSRTAA